jgi:16S rRNA (uracil1498-N3)-methyltransferase
MPRFFVDAPLALNACVELPPAARRHAINVLRLRPGALITLFNGHGGEFHGELLRAEPGQALVRLDAFLDPAAELPFTVTIVQGLPGADKMDWVVEKAVELGAFDLQPLAMERCVVRLAGERAARRRDHWQAIARSAAEQCGRNRVPAVHGLLTLEQWLGALPDAEVRLMACPGTERALATLAPPLGNARVQLVVGPEGGLSERESAALAALGFAAVSLGPRVLRTETAALAALAVLACAWAPGS